ncbi:hypothetical protein FBUS_02855 [Fasciolopsis buskii]|uniref:Uncharacterized protein n=1 Tax=Fasciolopsis buskii TaxID=27845 RepID=A0A8E0RWA1_9TREM|nr:hypothetical protein FBUS_02855 [Fasciolopsis buski]
MDPRYKFRHIKQVNLEEVEKTTEKFRLRSRDIKAKILALSEAREEIRKSQNMARLAQIWKEERNFLRSEEQEATIGLKHPSYKWIFDEKSIKQLSEVIAQKKEDFQYVVIKPIQALREDLRIWLKTNNTSHYIPVPEPVKKILREMNESLIRVEVSLREEEEEANAREERLSGWSSFGEEESNAGEKPSSTSTKDVDIAYQKEMGIPDDAWDWESPSEDFHTEMLAEFIKLDKLFFEKLECFQMEYDRLKQVNEDKWTAAELAKIEYFSEVFKRHAGISWRKLCIIFLGHILENRKTDTFERILDKMLREKQLRDRMYTVRRSWIKSRDDLSVRIRAVLLQAKEMAEQRRLEAEQQRTQNEICLILREQVRRWREEKAEIAEMEERERAAQAAEEEANLKAEKQKEQEERQATKAKVAAYKNLRNALKRQEEKKEATRLALLKDIHAKQARIDISRLLEVEKRRMLELKRKRVLAQQEAELILKAREERLEALREKVRPVVNKDHERAISETKSWKLRMEGHRHKIQSELEVDRPQLAGRYDAPLNTFSDEQLYADRRTRLTTALHAAGVLDSNYARALLATISASQPTRKDNVTTDAMKEVFWT